MQEPTEEKDRRLEFLDQVAIRLEKGAAEYGNGNLELPTPGTTKELLEEILDLAGWAYVLWLQMTKRLAAIEKGAQALEAELVPNGQAPGKRHATEIQRLTHLALTDGHAYSAAVEQSREPELGLSADDDGPGADLVEDLVVAEKPPYYGGHRFDDRGVCLSDCPRCSEVPACLLCPPRPESLLYGDGSWKCGACGRSGKSRRQVADPDPEC